MPQPLRFRMALSMYPQKSFECPFFLLLEELLIRALASKERGEVLE